MVELWQFAAGWVRVEHASSDRDCCCGGKPRRLLVYAVIVVIHRLFQIDAARDPGPARISAVGSRRQDIAWTRLQDPLLGRCARAGHRLQRHFPVAQVRTGHRAGECHPQPRRSGDNRSQPGVRGTPARRSATSREGDEAENGQEKAEAGRRSRRVAVPRSERSGARNSRAEPLAFSSRGIRGSDIATLCGLWRPAIMLRLRPKLAA